MFLRIDYRRYKNPVKSLSQRARRRQRFAEEKKKT